ncbi:OmpA family protein [Maribacter litoralis]|uniref:Outer membrane protein OmpA and related peptidoglycan-associated (Lipo)proteins n=1 Tax=Maribacter litoralis TaxID=2059726 RepID=A0A653VBR8_9FLAO|nr:OmpA family protein [Maribacter litoralis]VXB97280.1 Outer membrane protein OmpA and related peptidoglycan-associated (Lipo)proteins [Maribacter litoralis]
MKKTRYIFCGLAVMAIMANAQDKKIKKADSKFTSYAYASAIRSYEELVKDGYAEEEIYKNLGNANYLNANYEEASSWYGKLFALKKADFDPEYIYRYAQTLKSLGKYNESDEWMQKFKVAKASDQRALVFDQNQNYLEQIEVRSGRYQLKNIGLNSKVSDFAPSFYEKELVFSTARDSGLITKNIHKWNNGSFLNLYKAVQDDQGNFTNVDRLSKKLNKKTHESSTAFTKDGQTMYFTRNNSVDGKFERDEAGVSRLKIYKATLVDGEWNNIEELPFNGDSYSVAHPTLNKEETKLYFASDMPGTKGESDIYVVEINKDNTFGTPKNLGPRINTEARETFPFVTDSDILYFSSDGHPGLGGLDVFATDLKNENGEVFNVGRPLNGEEDDFSYIIDVETGKGFFASNRKGGQGNDDIYSFVELKPLDFTCNITIAGIVTDEETRAPLSNVAINVFDNDSKKLSTIQSDENGAFTLETECKEGIFKIVASKNDYDEGESTFVIEKGGDVSDVEIKLTQVDKSAPLGTDLAKYLNIEPIYFDFDKYSIRDDARASIDKVLAYLSEFPKINIQVRSHTDSRANDQYNQLLSDNRAKATAEYLIEKGISSDRISFKGYGETTLTNSCDNAVPCSKDNHQLNRRSEFIVVE